MSDTSKVPYEAVSVSSVNPLADQVQAWKIALWDAIYRWADARKTSLSATADQIYAAADVERAVEQAMALAIKAYKPEPVAGSVKTTPGISMVHQYLEAEARKKAIVKYLKDAVDHPGVSDQRIVLLRQRMWELEEYMNDVASDMGDAQAEADYDRAYILATEGANEQWFIENYPND